MHLVPWLKKKGALTTLLFEVGDKMLEIELEHQAVAQLLMTALLFLKGDSLVRVVCRIWVTCLNISASSKMNGFFLWVRVCSYG